ncbi:MAG: protein phosphatase 2C domain-containing protein [Sulfurimonas sp.]|nr:protein phosphatase 2C domain-containing protein [Sulfurimonas sp.]
MNLVTAFATEQGVSHKVSDTPCQDSVIVKQNDGYLFLGLSDGAGSAKHSDIGSKSILQFLSVHM